jgi:hypothetical protein
MLSLTTVFGDFGMGSWPHMAHIPKPSIATLAFHHENYNPSDNQHVQPLGFAKTHHGHARYRSVDTKLPARPRVPFPGTMWLTAGCG